MKVELHFTKSDEMLASKVHRLISIVFPIRQVEVELVLLPEPSSNCADLRRDKP